ncbi:MAG TPA: protein kinase [Ktedonobacteraceae bacterium]
MERQPAGKRERLGKYELLERLGQGGMGEVWKARDTQLQRYVAIKLLRADLQDNPDFGVYFKREARLVAALRHPNIVQIHDFQVAQGQNENAQAYMVMDYIEGGTLASAMRGSVRMGVFWPASEIVDLFASISLALDYAHRQGMIHRDIKPANILLDYSLSAARTLGEPVLTDFGIARWQGGSSTVTGFVGTPLYIAPEQAQGRPVNERSDLYSLGIILYEVLTGVPPFRGDNPLAIMLQHVEEQPPAPAQFNAQISPALSVVVLQSIAKDPGERYPSATAMTIALARAFNLPVPTRLVQSGESIEPSVYNPLQPPPGITPISPSFLLSTPQQAFSPARDNRAASPAPFPLSTREGDKITPAVGETTRQTPASPFSPELRQTPGGQPPPLSINAPPLQTVTATPRSRNQFGTLARKRLLLICLVCVGVLLLGLGAVIAAPRLFSSPASSTPAARDEVVGQLRFLSSASAPAGTFDEVQIDLNNVQPSPAGQVYYAWLAQENSEALTVPHWQIQVSNGALHEHYTSSPPRTNLLASSTLFLITGEDASGTPFVPYPSPARHYYYALITHTAMSSPAFEVKRCPTSNVNSASNPCR